MSTFLLRLKSSCLKPTDLLEAADLSISVCFNFKLGNSSKPSSSFSFSFWTVGFWSSLTVKGDSFEAEEDGAWNWLFKPSSRVGNGDLGIHYWVESCYWIFFSNTELLKLLKLLNEAFSQGLGLVRLTTETGPHRSLFLSTFLFFISSKNFLDQLCLLQWVIL